MVDWKINNPFYNLFKTKINYRKIAYKDRYTIPNYIITTSNDEFFLPDDSYYYFNDLPSDKYLRYVLNTLI